MKSLFLQSSIPQKTISSVLLFVIAVNMLFMFVLIPTKEAHAQLQWANVPATGAGFQVSITGDLPFNIWSFGDYLYKTTDTAFQKLQGVFSGITA